MTGRPFVLFCLSCLFRFVLFRSLSFFALVWSLGVSLRQCSKLRDRLCSRQRARSRQEAGVHGDLPVGPCAHATFNHRMQPLGLCDPNPPIISFLNLISLDPLSRPNCHDTQRGKGAHREAQGGTQHTSYYKLCVYEPIPREACPSLPRSDGGCGPPPLLERVLYMHCCMLQCRAMPRCRCRVLARCRCFSVA
jgi:hypothetical protein